MNSFRLGAKSSQVSSLEQFLDCRWNLMRSAHHESQLFLQNPIGVVTLLGRVQALRSTMTGNFIATASLTLPGPGFPIKKSEMAM